MEPDRQTPSQRPLRIFMAAGEVSSDRQAAHLARRLLNLSAGTRLFGCGGGAMQSAGVEVPVETAQYGCIGVQESARFSKPLRRALDDISKLVASEKPDVAVLVDSEHFNKHVASRLRRENIPFIYYFPPQVWLWGRWRARAIARHSRLIIPAFSAEVPIYKSRGGRVQWCGHPLLDLVKPEPDHAAIFRKFGLDPNLPSLGVMPGSRVQEIEELAPAMIAALRLIKNRHPRLQFIMPLAAPHLLPLLQKEIAAANLTSLVKIIDQHAYTCLGRCEAVMLSSGTATLEAALLGVPMVVAYRVKPLTYFVARHVVSTRFIAMPNILLDQPVVPELIQRAFTVDRLVSETLDILENGDRRRRMQTHLRKVSSLLGAPGSINRAAGLVLQEAGAAARTPAP